MHVDPIKETNRLLWPRSRNIIHSDFLFSAETERHNSMKITGKFITLLIHSFFSVLNHDDFLANKDKAWITGLVSPNISFDKVKTQDYSGNFGLL